MSREFPASTAEFIHKYIHSVEQLEILLLLYSTPERAWTVENVYEEIRSNLASVARRLAEMTAHGLLAASGGSEAAAYTYRPASAALARGVEELSTLYRERRVTVIEHIFAEPPSPIQGFADAFRIRKNEKNG